MVLTPPETGSSKTRLKLPNLYELRLMLTQDVLDTEASFDLGERYGCDIASLWRHG